MHYLTKNIDTHQIQAGDGSSLCIIHIGIASLSIFLKSFVFDNILAMLQITKILSQFKNLLMIIMFILIFMTRTFSLRITRGTSP
jgi:hypothetical protein